MTVDDTLTAIDRALAGHFSVGDDYTVGPDAMRAAPTEPASISRAPQQGSPPTWSLVVINDVVLTNGDDVYADADDTLALFVLEDGTILFNVHDPTACAGGGCAVHHPSPHHMSSWPRTWNAELRTVERVCAHRHNHPDPDDTRYRALADSDGMSVHLCDGCCHPPDPPIPPDHD